MGMGNHFSGWDFSVRFSFNWLSLFCVWGFLKYPLLKLVAT